MNVAAGVKKPMAIGILAAIALIVSAPPIAHATTADFLRQVRAAGIGTNAPDGALIEDAQEVCAMLDYQEAAYQYLNQHSGLDRNQSALFITASVMNFCPQYAPRMGLPSS
ncbi:hypothetical protein BN1232_05557 [Mycobacterium lentiflavum]|uniref:DUF732 domain-containing protein n=1 Tax=Mycobacterium lentiflavum TaxID=141349 RepID=A0A0E3WDZ0_MYCLN|nr:DUF732 domain-containing protein [Mycobacterium lentiflavum]MEE3064116.1 DUF732 domain-containing protein [Actinomycetota bacterium]ULP42246.1 DUF732 domain-containing protein [Mycobacterium lentiflavum]CQD22239.1 hypothetical protein BN1232_05557 [Mycobacterium lentiflavum]